MGRFIPIIISMGMSGYLSALRYFERSGQGPRTTRPDGRPFVRPLRARSEAVREAARRHRAKRRQPLWPRVLGWSLLCIASVAAFGAEYPIPTPVPSVSSETIPGTLVAIRPYSPAGSMVSVPAGFQWKTLAAPPFTVVLFDEAYREVGRLEGLQQLGCATPDEWRAALEGGGTFYWRVMGAAEGRLVRSELARCEIR